MIAFCPSARDILCEVVEGGMLSRRKSINVPYVKLNMPFLSEQDKSDLRFGVELDVDFVAASFVSKREDLEELHEFLDANGGKNIDIVFLYVVNFLSKILFYYYFVGKACGFYGLNSFKHIVYDV